jgi:hypothetical protein
LHDPQLAGRMGEAGRLVVERGFSCAAQLAGTENLYERLSKSRRKVRNAERSQPSDSQLRSENFLQGE